MKTKVCTKCGIEKPISEFTKMTRAKDGLQYHCKQCKRNYHVPWYDKLTSDDDAMSNRLRRQAEHRERNKDLYREYDAVSYAKRSQRVKAKNASRHMRKPGLHIHHWNYADEYHLDIFYLTQKEHGYIHRFLTYLPNKMVYMEKSTGIVLDTREIHNEFINDCLWK